MAEKWGRYKQNKSRVEKPTGKSPRGWANKRLIDVVEEDLDRIRVWEWRKLAFRMGSSKWRDLLMAVKTLSEY